MGAAKHYVNKLWKGDEEEAEVEEVEEVEVEVEKKVWKEGDEAEAKFTDGEYYWGKISKIYKNGNFLFYFDDGDKSRSMEGRFIRERTPIVGPDESDITDGIEIEEEEVEDMEVEATISYNKKYYIDALTEFLTAEMKDYEYFLYGTRTNSTESFHNLCNKYYSKGSTLSYPLYKMKKQFAALDWNEQKDRQFCVFDPTVTLVWYTAIINAFIKRKSYLKAQHVLDDRVRS